MTNGIITFMDSSITPLLALQDIPDSGGFIRVIHRMSKSTPKPADLKAQEKEERGKRRERRERQKVKRKINIECHCSFCGDVATMEEPRQSSDIGRFLNGPGYGFRSQQQPTMQRRLYTPLQPFFIIVIIIFIIIENIKYIFIHL